MGKKCGGYVPITEHAPRAAEALRKAVDGELLQAYRTPINDVLRELAYQTARANDLAERLDKAYRKLERRALAGASQ
jgi:hypothetical protein